MKKKHFLFTSMAIAAILSANVAQAEELAKSSNDADKELVISDAQPKASEAETGTTRAKAVAGPASTQQDQEDKQNPQPDQASHLPEGAAPHSVATSSTSPASIVLVTETAAKPKVSEVVTSQTEFFTPDVNGTSVDVSTPYLRLEKLDHPVVVTQHLINEETGKVSASSTVAQNGVVNPNLDADKQDLRPYVSFQYKDLAVGRYRSEFTFTDLEDRVLGIDSASQDKLASYPIIEVKALEFVEPTLLSVTADKASVKKGETVTYTFTFDRSAFKSDKSIKMNYKVDQGDNQAHSYSHYDHIYSDGRMTVSVTGWLPGDISLSFAESDSYSIFDNQSDDYKQVASISQEMKDKIKTLLPKVVVLDEEQEKNTGVKKISLLHVKADGTELVLPPHRDRTDDFRPNYQLITLAVGDKLVYDIELEDGKAGGTASANFYFGGAPKKTEDGNYEKNYDVSYFTAYEHIEKTTPNFRLELPITANYYGTLNSGYIDIYSNDKRLDDAYEKLDAYSGYLFSVDNPKPSVSFTAVAPEREVYYLGEFPTLTAKLSETIDLNQVDAIELWLAGNTTSYSDVRLSPVTVYKDITDADGKRIDGEWVLSDERLFSTTDYQNKKVGIVSYTKAVVRFKDDSKVEVESFPGLNYRISDEKKYIESGAGAFLVSGQDKAHTLSSSPIWTELGRVPEALQNRALRTHKVLLHDSAGRLVKPTETDLIFYDYDLTSESDVYYYLPLSGQLTKLTPKPYHNKRYSVPVTETTGVYVIADKKGAETINTHNQSKILTQSDTDIYVRVTESDINAVASIKAEKVTETSILEKLPEEIKPQDIDLFDIKTLDKDGKFVQIKAEATVTLPVIPGRKVTKIIYFLPETGAVEELAHEWHQELNQVIFKVSHFSNYGVVYEAQASQPEPETPSPKPEETTPQPGVVPPKPDGTTPQPGVVPPKPDGTTPKPDVVSPQPGTPTSRPEVTTVLSKERHKLLLTVDQSQLTDQQKGQLAEQIAFAETEQELAKIKVEVEKLVAQGTTSPVDGKLKALSSEAPRPSTSEAKTGLPKTGEQSHFVTVATGIGLLLSSLGLANRRKRC
ncbi:LPXTG cell wall anchor domain-containing protein [Streptococcus entericus]|uniref:LPXTG cell wall anchor domain-containing protein n=1 Tax=Streptococcus entericus TaxID=155680 RepID=UPI0003756F39|nr:LPXTG cell wall anchor domain-containing protein [Streptococcus entericus]